MTSISFNFINYDSELYFNFDSWNHLCGIYYAFYIITQITDNMRQ